MLNAQKKSIWVFGDYRNYFENRVTLQLLARAGHLAQKLGAEVCAVVFGHRVDEYVGEYIAHGAERVLVADHPRLAGYKMDAYVHLMVEMVKKEKPEILLVGATGFGLEFAPRVARRLGTGLTADCVGLDTDDNGNLVQIAPAFGGNLLAEIITPDTRPQMATVRPGIFQEIPHNYEAKGEIAHVDIPEDLPNERIRRVKSEKIPPEKQKIEEAKVVICGGRGMGSKNRFKKLYELAKLMNGEVGATRPVVYSGWAGHESLVGQAGKQVSPQVLISFGISGAIQHTAAITGAGFIICVNKNPEAAMMKMADVAIVADAGQVCTTLIRELKNRIRR